MSDTCVNTDMLQFSWLVLFCQLAVVLNATQTGDAERKSVETKTPNSAVAANSMASKYVLCIQTVNKVLISIFPDL
jgi:NADH:ubiquinone oxidoreductase subunit 6 (subunit J)